MRAEGEGGGGGGGRELRLKAKLLDVEGSKMGSLMLRWLQGYCLTHIAFATHVPYIFSFGNIAYNEHFPVTQTLRLKCHLDKVMHCNISQKKHQLQRC